MKVQMIQNNVASQPKNKHLYWPKKYVFINRLRGQCALVQHFYLCSDFHRYFLSDQFRVFSIRAAAALQLPWTALPRRSWFVRPEPGRHAHARAEKRERDFPSPITLHMWTGGFLHMPAHVEVFLCTFKRHNYKGWLQFLIGCIAN